MHQIRVYDPSCINREDRCKSNGVRHLSVLPNGKCVNLIADQMDLVSLTKFHESDEDLSGEASTLETVNSNIERHPGSLAT